MYNRCGTKSKNDLRVKSAAKSDAQCRVSRLPRVRTCTSSSSSSSSSTRRGATIDSRESSADVDERWEKKKKGKKGEKKREKFHAAKRGYFNDTQGFHRVKVTAHRFGTPSPIRSTPILDSVLKFNQRPPPPPSSLHDSKSRHIEPRFCFAFRSFLHDYIVIRAGFYATSEIHLQPALTGVQPANR